MNEEISKEQYQESLKKDIENSDWAEKFINSDDWKKLSTFITDYLPTQSPYNLESMEQLKAQGALITGLLFPERLLNMLIQKGAESKNELKENPNAE